MPRRWDPLIDQKLKTEMCPGGRGHNPGPRFKSQCVLCRQMAHLAPPEPAPATVPVPASVPEQAPVLKEASKKGFVSSSKAKKKKLV